MRIAASANSSAPLAHAAYALMASSHVLPTSFSRPDFRVEPGALRAGIAGGQGTVIAAMHKNGVVFALKVINLAQPVAGVGGHFAYDDSEGSALHEASLATSMVYPFIVPSLGSFIHLDQLFIVMKRLAGSLDVTAVMSDAMRARTARDVLTHISFALEYIHSRGMVHCDIKPDNVLVSDRCDSSLCDFGIARHVDTGAGDFAPQGETPMEVRGAYCQCNSHRFAPHSFPGRRHGAIHVSRGLRSAHGWNARGKP